MSENYIKTIKNALPVYFNKFGIYVYFVFLTFGLLTNSGGSDYYTVKAVVFSFFGSQYMFFQ